jgi:hypothetical protein
MSRSGIEYQANHIDAVIASRRLPSLSIALSLDATSCYIVRHQACVLAEAWKTP